MNNIYPTSAPEQTAFSLRNAASVWFRHKLLIAVTFLTIAVGTAVVTFMTPNEYESRMKILVKNVRSEVPITPQQTTGAYGPPNAEVSEAEINSEIELLTSQDLLNQVVTACGLTRPDVVRPSLTAEAVLAAAPASEQQRFSVPRILDED